MNKFLDKARTALRKEGRASGAVLALAAAALIAVNVLLFVLTEAFGLYLYKKPEDDLSLSGNTDVLFADAITRKEKIKISFCMPKEDIEEHSVGKTVHTTALNFLERYPELVEIEYINVLTRRNSKGELVDLGKYKTDMRGEETRIIKTSVIFESGDNYRVVTDAQSTTGFVDFFTIDSAGNTSSYNGEELMAAMMSWVLKTEHRTVYFTQRHGEAADIAFSNLLVCAGYYIDTVDLRNEYVPSDAAMVFISNPKTDFERAAEGSGIITEIERLKIYLASGGNLFVTLDPYVKTLHVLESFLREYGIEFSSTVMPSGAVARNLVKDSSSAITVDGFTLVADYAEGELPKRVSDKVASYSDGSVILREASALKLSGAAKPLLVSSPSSVVQAGGATVDSSGSYTLAAYSEMAASDGKQSKVFVVPSIYLAVSDSLVSRGYSNKDFTYALFEEFFGSDTPPYGCHAVIADETTLQNLTMGTAKLYTALICAIPVLLAVFGAVIIIKRKNR